MIASDSLSNVQKLCMPRVPSAGENELVIQTTSFYVVFILGSSPFFLIAKILSSFF